MDKGINKLIAYEKHIKVIDVLELFRKLKQFLIRFFETLTILLHSSSVLTPSTHVLID